MDCPLSARQYEVVLLAMRGLETKQIAVSLGITVSTVRSHLFEARKTLGLTGQGRGALMALMLNRGWVDPAGVAPEVASYSTWLSATKRDLDWRPSAAQRCYLTAFDRLLRRRDPVSAAALDLAFRLMCWEAGSPIPRPTFDPDAVVDRVDAMLLGLARGLMRQIPLCTTT